MEHLYEALQPAVFLGLELIRMLGDVLYSMWEDNRQEIITAAGIGLLAVIRASAVTIRSGYSGLRFHCGRAGRTVGPGLHLMIPFLQRIKQLPTRARTMDLESQRVTTLDGLVYLVEAHLVYRVVDMRRALIQIHDLEQGMRQMSTLAIQELLRVQDAERLRDREHLDEELRVLVEQRLEPWGVEVQRAGFGSITPSDRTLRLTQLQQRVAAREQSLTVLRRQIHPRTGLGLLGARADYQRRGQWLRRQEAGARHERRVVVELVQRGITRVGAARGRRLLATGWQPEHPDLDDDLDE